MARTSTYPLADRALNGQLGATLQDLRSKGLSFEAVAKVLVSDYDLDVSSATVRRWCDRLAAEPQDAT